MTRQLRCFTVLFVILLGMAVAGAAQAATLVADYRFEGNDLGTDSSGMANHGTVQGGVTQVEGRLPGTSAAFFDGSSGTIRIDPLNGYTGLPGFTMSAWVKLDPGTGGFDGVISQDNGACCETRLLLTAGHNPYINVHQHADKNLTSTSLVVDQWEHIVLTGENVGGVGVARVYINGVEIPGSPQNFELLGSSETFFTYLGAGEAGTAHLLRGALDDVQIYEGALTAGEVETLFIGIPEPTSIVLAAIALSGLCLGPRRRRRSV